MKPLPILPLLLTTAALALQGCQAPPPKPELADSGAIKRLLPVIFEQCFAAAQGKPFSESALVSAGLKKDNPKDFSASIGEKEPVMWNKLQPKIFVMMNPQRMLYTAKGCDVTYGLPSGSVIAAFPLEIMSFFPKRGYRVDYDPSKRRGHYQISKGTEVYGVQLTLRNDGGGQSTYLMEMR